MTRQRTPSLQTRIVLASLLDGRLEWRHGYDLIGMTGLKSGTLYPILVRLHDQGLLDSRWEPAAVAGRPPRHAYRLTTDGVALARSLASEATTSDLCLSGLPA